MYSRYLGRFISLVALIIAISCSGVGSGGEGVTSSSSSKSLRLGQGSSTNSAVAVSAAIDTLESLVVLGSSPNSTDITHVLYRASSNQVARITVGPGGLPVSAATSDANASFSNFTDTTVDVTIVSNGQTVTVTAPLQDETVGLLKSGSIYTRVKATSLPVLRELLRSTLVAVRTFGCAGEFAATNIAVGSVFQELVGATCRSELLNVIKETVDDRDEDIIEKVIEDLPEESTCDFRSDSWVNDFSNAQRCAGIVGETLVQKVIQATPLPGAIVNNTDDPRLDPNESGNIPQDINNQIAGLPIGPGGFPLPNPTATPTQSPIPSPSASPSPSATIPGPKPPTGLQDPPTPPVPEDPVAEVE